MERAHTTWIVVANSALAKIFRLVRFPKIEPITTLEHPESRMHDQDLVSSKPGTAFQSMSFARHPYQPPTDPKLLEAEKFAKILGDYLSSCHQKGECTRLYLMASPAFLGMLRPHISPKLHEAIVAEAHKDMTEATTQAIEHHLSEL